MEHTNLVTRHQNPRLSRNELRPIEVVVLEVRWRVRLAWPLVIDPGLGTTTDLSMILPLQPSPTRAKKSTCIHRSERVCISMPRQLAAELAMSRYQTRPFPTGCKRLAHGCCQHNMKGMPGLQRFGLQARREWLWNSLIVLDRGRIHTGFTSARILTRSVDAITCQEDLMRK